MKSRLLSMVVSICDFAPKRPLPIARSNQIIIVIHIVLISRIMLDGRSLSRLSTSTTNHHRASTLPRRHLCVCLLYSYRFGISCELAHGYRVVAFQAEIMAVAGVEPGWIAESIWGWIFGTSHAGSMPTKALPCWLAVDGGWPWDLST